MKTSLIGVLALVVLSGCGNDEGGSSSPGVLETMGMLGVPLPTLIGQNVMLVDVTLNGHGGGRLLVDTGSPLTLVNPAPFGQSLLPAKLELNVDIGVGALTINQVPVIQLSGAAMDRLRLAGLLGGNVLRQFSTAFNYRDHQFQIGGAAMPSDTAQVVKVPFKLSGGGAGLLNETVIRYEATRIPVKATVEGTEHWFVLDTGASDVTLRTSLFDRLVADGRATIDDLPISTVAGQTKARVTRSRSVSVAGQEVTNIPVMAFDNAIIDSMSTELGYSVDGLLGGDFLREFAVTIDYPAGQVVLSRYATRDHIVDEFKRVGLWLTASGTTFAVSAVRRGSAAQQLGVAIGDQVVSIDGQALADLDTLSADALLYGDVGSSRRVGFGQTSDAALAQSEKTIAIEDLVPVPN